MHFDPFYYEFLQKLRTQGMKNEGDVHNILLDSPSKHMLAASTIDGKSIDKYHYVSIHRRIEKYRYIFHITIYMDIFLTCRVDTV